MKRKEGFMGKKKIAIDAGHGSNTPGKRTPPFTKAVDIDRNGSIDILVGEQYREHYANVGVANLLYKKLADRGYDVIKVGWNDTNSKDDEDISLSTRQSKIKKEGCDYSVSIHFNAYGDGQTFNSVRGVGIYIHSVYPADSRYLAEAVLKELVKGTMQVNRGIYSARFAMCNCEAMNTKASILCELAFMTNEKEALELMANTDFWNECAEEIARGIDQYCNCSNNEDTVTEQKIKLYHTVVAGETLSKIAEENNTTVEKLVKLNNIENPDIIMVGQKILLLEYIKYTVRKGDTLSDISKKFLNDASRYPEIMDFNNLSSTTILVNQILKIPV